MKLKGNPKRARLVGGLLLLAALLALFPVCVLELPDLGMAIFSVLGLVLFLAAILVLLLFWRCPCCDRVLPTPGLLGMDYCPYCGGTIEDDP